MRESTASSDSHQSTVYHGIISHILFPANVSDSDLGLVEEWSSTINSGHYRSSYHHDQSDEISKQNYDLFKHIAFGSEECSPLADRENLPMPTIENTMCYSMSDNDFNLGSVLGDNFDLVHWLDVDVQVDDVTQETARMWTSQKQERSLAHNPLSCDVCGYVGRSKYHLNRHKSRHSTERPLACSEPGCAKTFKTSNTLYEHKRFVHYKNHRLACKKCSFVTNREKILLRHSKTHSEDRIYHCPIPLCSKSFKNRKSLMTHQRNVHSISNTEDVFECGLCFHLAKTKKEIDSHMEEHPTGVIIRCYANVYE